MTPAIDLVDNPGPIIRRAIAQPLRNRNDTHTGRPHRFSTFALTLTAPDSRAIVGGLWSEVGRSHLFIDLQFVPKAMRGRGIGRSLLQQAEQEASRRGCQAAWLATYSFQASGFYQKLGYRIFGELPELPPEKSSIFLTKILAPILP